MKKILLFIILGILIVSGCASTDDEPIDDDTGEDIPVEDLKDYYEMVNVNISYGDETYFWASNTNSRTLGAAIATESYHNDFFELEDTADGRVIHSYEGFENNEDNRWIILSESCGEELEEEVSQQCDDDVDSIILDEEKSFMILYADMDDLDLVE